VSAWDANLAFERARTAYRYVAQHFPSSVDLEVTRKAPAEHLADMLLYGEGVPADAWRRGL
jgi:hypothetical protein